MNLLTALERQSRLTGAHALFDLDKAKKAIKKAYKADPIAFKKLKKKDLAGWIYLSWKFWTK